MSFGPMKQEWSGQEISLGGPPSGDAYGLRNHRRLFHADVLASIAPGFPCWVGGKLRADLRQHGVALAEPIPVRVMQNENGIPWSPNRKSCHEKLVAKQAALLHPPGHLGHDEAPGVVPENTGAHPILVWDHEIYPRGLSIVISA